MNSLLLAPHADDESLFAAYTCAAHRPHIVICLKDTQEPRRWGEAEQATRILGCSWSQLSCGQQNPDWDELETKLHQCGEPEQVFAPAVEEQGHEQHNLVGLLALKVFGPKRVTQYLTYAPRGQRSRNGLEVKPEPPWITWKLRAMACYESQIENPATKPWFYQLLDMREFIVA